MTAALTRRESGALAFLRDYTAAHGYPPTVREIGVHVGLRSTSSVAHVLDSLVGKGVIRRDFGTPRGLVVLEARA
jgi:repressor LexA